MNNYNIKALINQGLIGRQDFKIIFNEEIENQYLPISLINGKEKGKTFTLIAGIHGCEYPPIIALQEVLNEINPNQLKGSIIIIPIANIDSFYQRTPFLHPEDKKNLNNVFPGSDSGSISEKIANWITQNVIPNSDIFLDIHGGDANEDLIPFACYYNNKNNQNNTDYCKKLCEVSGLPYIVSFPYNISSTEPALYAVKQATQNGIVALSLEAGKLGNLQDNCVKLLKNAIYNLLDFSNLYPNPNKKTNHKQIFLSQQIYIKSPEKGIFYSKNLSGEIVKKGENLGYITDIFGSVIQKIISPTDGIILYKIGTPPVNKNETLFCIGN